ncbi:MAG TPA: hypothetical protein VME86_11210, partial [Acidobacteriaceae bacterium]|nr:hypothetical protein [Acidobacteriaceae bacterium]
GDKSRTGALVRCIYDGGDLVKRIVALEPPYRMVFDVLEQRLGIEGCVVAQKGSYEIDSNGEGSDVILTTQYWAFLHPRWLWRSIEHVVASQLHLHILNAMRGCETERALAAESTGPELSANVTTADLATKPGEVAQRGGSRLAV